MNNRWTMTCRYCKRKTATLIKIRYVTPVAVCERCHSSFEPTEKEIARMLVRTCDLPGCANVISDGDGAVLSIQMTEPLGSDTKVIDITLELCDECAGYMEDIVTPEHIRRSIVTSRGIKNRKAAAEAKRAETSVTEGPLTM